MVSVCFASALRSVSNGEPRVELENFEGDLRALLAKLAIELGPGLEERVLFQGEVRRFINIYVDGHDVRFTGGLATPVPRAAVVDLIPAVAGG